MNLSSKRARLALLAAVLAAAWISLGTAAEQPAPPAKAAAKAETPAKTEAAATPAAEPAKPADAKDAQADSKSGKKTKSLGGFLWENTTWLGWIVYAAELALSLVATTVVLERTVNLRRRKLIPRRFVRRLHDLLSRHEDSAENLRTLCENSESPIASVLMGGVVRAGRPLPEIDKAMEDALIREASTQRSRNRILGVIGTVAPMVGLLGTVVGMILALHDTSEAGAGKAEKLAEGICLALGGTAGGLLVGVPALLFVHVFNSRVDRYTREMVDVLQETIPTFAALERVPESNGEAIRATEPISRVKTH